MRIGVTSQNFRTITGHAGKTRRFLVYQATGCRPPSPTSTARGRGTTKRTT
jgi:hypothetical protein